MLLLAPTQHHQQHMADTTTTTTTSSTTTADPDPVTSTTSDVVATDSSTNIDASTSTSTSSSKKPPRSKKRERDHDGSSSDPSSKRPHLVGVPSAAPDDPFKSLSLAPFECLANLDGRFACPKCNRSRKYFCYTCLTWMAGVEPALIPQVQLPVELHMYDVLMMAASNRCRHRVLIACLMLLDVA